MHKLKFSAETEFRAYVASGNFSAKRGSRIQVNFLVKGGLGARADALERVALGLERTRRKG